MAYSVPDPLLRQTPHWRKTDFNSRSLREGKGCGQPLQASIAVGAEERTAWCQPIDLIALCQRAGLEVPHLFTAGDNVKGWSDHVTLSESLLGDDPAAIIAALTAAARDGATPSDLGRALAYAAALRVARFATANERSDWETAHHVFTYANAVHQALKRIGSGASEPVEAARGLLLWPGSFKAALRVSARFHERRRGSLGSKRHPEWPIRRSSQHRYQHYIDFPFVNDGTPLVQPKAPNAETQISAFREIRFYLARLA